MFTFKKIKTAFYNEFRKNNIKAIFHLPGSAVVPLYEELDKFKLVLMKHPENVGFAADSFGRLNGLGVGIVAQGPGMAGILPALIHSWKDHTPVVIITAKPHYMNDDPGAWQAFPVKETFAPVIKKFIEVAEGGNAAKKIHLAFKIAKTPPCGPVVINILEKAPRKKTGITSKETLKVELLKPVSMVFLKKVLRALKRASKPLIIAGGGAIEDREILKALMQKYNIPVVTTSIGRGVIDEKNPLCLGPVGTIGFDAANKALCEADFILAIGARLSKNVIQPLISSKRNPVIFQIAGDKKDRSAIVKRENFSVSTVESIIKKLLNEKINKYAGWFNKAQMPETTNLPAVLLKILRLVGEDDLLIMDAGTIGLPLYKAFTARKPYHLLYQWGMATMGTSLPSSVGASFSGAKRIFVITGDGAFVAGSSELTTISENSLPVKIIVFNNGGLEFIRQIQNQLLGRDVGLSFGPYDFAAFAEAVNIKSARVKEDDELSHEILSALRDKKPFILDVSVKDTRLDLKNTQWDKK